MKYLSMAALLVVGAIIMSCSNNDDMPGEDQPKSLTVTVTTTISLDNGVETRALDADGHKTFAAGDMIAVIYKNTSNVTVKATSTALDGANISSDKKTATFTVTLDNPQAGTVEYVYPAAMANDDGTMASIDSQDGTLATIQSQYDYAKGSGTMTVSGTDVTLPTGVSLTNQLAICKFTLKSGGTDITNTITNLTISDGTHLYVVTRKEAAGPIYVAMQPVSGKTITLYAASSSEGYTKTTASSQTLEANNFYSINASMTPGNMVSAMQATPLSLEAKTGGTIIVTRVKDGMQYTKNGSAKMAVPSEGISVATGDVLQFYGNGTSIARYGGTTDDASTKIEGSADFYAYGSIMSLLDEKGFVTNKNFTTSTNTYTFAFLFYGNTNPHLYSHSHKTLELPATTLKDGCYNYLFYGCTNLTEAPALPAATLAKSCYENMFRGCTSLTKAPVLSAAALVNSCYAYMFYGCTSLNYVKCLTTENNPGSSGKSYTTNWLHNVSQTGTFVKNSSTTWNRDASGIPSGWTPSNE